MIKIIDYLNIIKINGVKVAPIVTDLFNKNNGMIDFEGFEKLDSNTSIGIVRALRYSKIKNAKSHLLHIITISCDKGDEETMLEAIKSLSTLDPCSFEELGLIKSELAYIENKYAHLKLQINASLIQLEAKLDKNKISEINLEDSTKGLTNDSKEISEDIVICQFSDIHFGKCHAYHLEGFNLEEYKGPTIDLSNFLKMRLKCVPDYYVYCGDIISEKEEEYNYFEPFIKNLPLIDSNIKDKLLIVPGNHDNIWVDKINDELSAFKKNITDKGYITPFGIDDNNCIRTNYKGCPLSIFLYPDKKILFLLLTSSFYNGIINDEMYKIYEEAKKELMLMIN